MQSGASKPTRRNLEMFVIKAERNKDIVPWWQILNSSVWFGEKRPGNLTLMRELPGKSNGIMRVACEDMRGGKINKPSSQNISIFPVQSRVRSDWTEV